MPFRNLCPFCPEYKGCFVQTLRPLESSGRTCQHDESSCSDRSSHLLGGIYEQVLGGRTFQSQWRSQWLLLGNGTSLCYCKSLGSNMLLFPRNRAVLGWCRIPRSSPFRSKWGAHLRRTPFCKAAVDGTVWGRIRDGWMHSPLTWSEVPEGMDVLSLFENVNSDLVSGFAILLGKATVRQVKQCSSGSNGLPLLSTWSILLSLRTQRRCAFFLHCDYLQLHSHTYLTSLQTHHFLVYGSIHVCPFPSLPVPSVQPWAVMSVTWFALIPMSLILTLQSCLYLWKSMSQLGLNLLHVTFRKIWKSRWGKNKPKESIK